MQRINNKIVVYILFGISFYYSSVAVAQEGHRQHSILQLIEWMEVKPGDNNGILSILRRLLEDMANLSVRVTSPDIPMEKRRLWIMPINNGKPRLLSEQTSVRNPKWGKKDWIAYEQESDTNGDGFIDFHDRMKIQIIKLNTGHIRSIGEGVTPIWSPDGEALAFIRDGEIQIYKLSGSILSVTQAKLEGELVYSNKRSKALADKFWMININNGIIQKLPEDLQRKYLWLGVLSSDGQRMLMSDASHSDIFIRKLSTLDNHGINLTQDKYIDLEPHWSPDEKSIVFVSDRPVD